MDTFTAEMGNKMSESDPFVGVISANSVEFLWDEIDYGTGINVTEEEIVQEYCQENDCTEDEIPEDFWDCLDIEEAIYLIGDWILSPLDGKYMEYLGDCGYSAIVQTLGGAYNAHVTYSKTIAHVASMCSSCCPNQADLDSGKGSILAYTLPDWLMGETT